MHQIDFIPGSADLGDFDATSTTIALNPVGADSWLPPAALAATFERYWQNVKDRHDPATSWDAYTPYELRTVGAMLRLGETERAWALLDWFLADQEPPSWHQWPEVVFRNPHELKFIGDLPHTWVGSDFLRSAADLFAWERESDQTLVLGQGIKPEWLDDGGTHVRNLHTWWGTLNYRAHRDSTGTTLDIEAGLRVPAGGIEIAMPGMEGHQVTVDGAPVALDAAGRFVVRALPAEISIR